MDRAADRAVVYTPIPRLNSRSPGSRQRRRRRCLDRHQAPWVRRRSGSSESRGDERWRRCRHRRPRGGRRSFQQQCSPSQTEKEASRWKKKLQTGVFSVTDTVEVSRWKKKLPTAWSVLRHRHGGGFQADKEASNWSVLRHRQDEGFKIDKEASNWSVLRHRHGGGFQTDKEASDWRVLHHKHGETSRWTTKLPIGVFSVTDTVEASK